MLTSENLAFKFTDGLQIKFPNLNAQVGEKILITGSSGSGKSTLLNLLSGVLAPQSGSIKLLGKNTTTLSNAKRDLFRAQHIGVVFQDFRLIDHLSVYENITLPLRIAGHKHSFWHENAVELLNWVGLGQRLEALPETLSGGEQQRAAIARAVITRPRIIIADEPTGNVDPEIGERLLRLLIELNKMGTTIVIATHDRQLWEKFDFPRLHLDNGQLALMHGGV